jgi:hypothetical protein
MRLPWVVLVSPPVARRSPSLWQFLVLRTCPDRLQSATAASGLPTCLVNTTVGGNDGRRFGENTANI